MKFKILKGTKSYEQFVALQAEMKRCNAAAKALAKEVGVKQWHYAWYAIAGGISAFIFDKKPAGWGNAFIPHEEGAYMPKKNLTANKELLQKVKDLPLVDEAALNSIVKYDARKHCSTRKRMMHPGLSFHKDYVLLSFSESADKYVGTKDMIEITTTEFNKLAKAK